MTEAFLPGASLTPKQPVDRSPVYLLTSETEGPQPLHAICLDPTPRSSSTAASSAKVPSVLERPLLDAWTIVFGQGEFEARRSEAEDRVAVQERICTPKRIEEVSTKLAAYGSVGVFHGADGRSTRAQIISYSAADRSLTWRLEDKLPDSPFLVEVVGYNSVYQFHIEDAVQWDDTVAVKLPVEILRIRRRWERRTRAREGTYAVLNIDGERGRAIVRDISFSGLCFWRLEAEAEFEVDQLIDIEINFPGVRPMVTTGVVRHANPCGDGRRYGVELTLDDPEVRQRWHYVVARLLHRRTSSGDFYCDAIWRLYQRAGYFNLSGKEPDDFEELRCCFRRNTEALANCEDLAYTSVWPIRGTDEILATMSMLKTYEHTWFLYQVAKSSGAAPDGTTSREVLRDIHLDAIEQVQLDPSMRWILIYLQDENTWSRAIHYEIPRRYAETGLSCVVPFRALEVQSDGDWPSQKDLSMEVSPATAEEIAALLEYLDENRPRPYVEALDLVPERVDFSHVRDRYATAGVERDRCFWAVRKDGELLAAAVVENGAEGLHLFRLLDVVRPFPMTDDAELAARAVSQLVLHARSLYRAFGKTAFCCFLEDDNWLPEEDFESCEDMGKADTSVLSATLVPEILEHLVELTAPRTP